MFKKQNKEKNTFGRMMTWRYLSALGGLAFLAIAAYSIFLRGVNDIQNDAFIMNVSGRQRMFSQRAALLSLRLASAKDVTERNNLRREVSSLVLLMDEAHYILTYARPDLAEKYRIKLSSQLEEIFFKPPLNLSHKLHDYIAALSALVNTPDTGLTEDNLHLRYIITQHEELLDGLDTAVRQYESESESRVSSLRRLANLFLIFAILILALMGLFIFWPFTHRVQGEIDKTKAAEGSLRVSNQNIEGIIRAAPLALISIDSQGKVKEWNTAAERMFGWAKSEVLGKPLVTVPKDSLNEHVQLRERVLKGETLSGIEVKRRKKDGSIIDTSLSVAPLYDITGNISGMMGIIEDITEAKKAQERQKNIVSGLRVIMEIADNLILCPDTDSLLKMAVEEARGKLNLERCAIFLEVDGNMQGTYGTDRHGKTTDEHNHRFPKNGAWAKRTQEIRSTEAQWFVVEEPYLEWDGAKNVEIGGKGWITVTPIGSMNRIIGSFVNDAAFSKKPLDPVQQEILSVFTSLLGNVIERRRFEDSLFGANQFRENLLKTIPFGMDIVDAQGNILYVNEVFKRQVGYDPTGRKCFEAYKDDKQQCAYCPLKKDIILGEIKYLETSGALGGKTFKITHIGMIYKEEKAVMEIFEDITVQKESEQKLREAITVKSEFISMVSHELRTPLTAIKEGIAIVADESAGKVNIEQRSFLDIAQRNVQRLSRFINNVLDYQKLDSGRMEFFIQPNDINAVTQEVRDDMLLHAQNKGLNFFLELTPHLPKAEFDRDKIFQVLYNLVYNAIKFTESGAVTIRTEKVDDAIRVSIVDTGIGIRKEDGRKLFQDFSQLASGKERRTGSTGLGLAISRKLVIHHGGQIWFESAFGKGSTFYFTLPVR